MSVHYREETLEWNTANWQWQANPPYAYPRCEVNAEESLTKTYRALLLENAYLRLVVLPELGGRIWSLYDKMRQRELVGQPECLLPQRLTLSEKPTERWLLRGGIQFHPVDLGSPCALHPVMTHAELPLDESAPGTLWVGGYDLKYPLFWQVGMRLLPDHYALELDYRVYNRSLRPLPYRFFTLTEVLPGWQVAPAKVWSADRLLPLSQSQEGDGACAVLPDRLGGVYDFTFAETPHLLSTRFSDNDGWRWLAPHMTDTWRERWMPLQGVKQTVSLEKAGGIEWLSDSNMRLHSPCLRAEHTLQLRAETGQTVEAQVSLYVEQPALLRLPEEAGVIQIARLIAPTGETVWSFTRKGEPESGALPTHWNEVPLPERSTPLPLCYETGLRAFLKGEFTHAENALHESAFDLGWRSISHYLLALIALRREDYARALIHLEECLIYNGGDSQAWMLRAACWRWLGHAEEASYERENARVLSPLDPLQRAEMFLSVDRMENAEPGRLLQPVMRPEWIACMADFYQEAGLFGDAQRLLGEGLRLQPTRLLHQRMGACFEQMPAFQAAAAEQNVLAKRLPEDMFVPSSHPSSPES